MMLLIVLVAALWPIAGWAEETIPKCEKGARNCLTIVLPNLPPQYEIIIESHHTRCENRMEAAMQIMQPYLGTGITMFAVTPEDAKLHNEMMRAKAYWDTVAKACWRQP